MVAVYTGSEYKIYDESLLIEEAAAGILSLLEGYKEIGIDNDYERNVRLLSYDAQMKAPNLTMHKLRTGKVSNPYGFKEGEDVFELEDDVKHFSARGFLKMSYLLARDEKNPKAIIFMNNYYDLLSKKKYGKTPAAIKQEIRKLSKDNVLKWIEQTFKKYITDDMEVFNLMNNGK